MQNLSKSITREVFTKEGQFGEDGQSFIQLTGEGIRQEHFFHWPSMPEEHTQQQHATSYTPVTSKSTVEHYH